MVIASVTLTKRRRYERTAPGYVTQGKPSFVWPPKDNPKRTQGKPKDNPRKTKAHPKENPRKHPGTKPGENLEKLPGPNPSVENPRQ